MNFDLQIGDFRTPAFQYEKSPHTDSISMIDYFAAKAMVALIPKRNEYEDDSDMAEQAYLIAAAMLEMRRAMVKDLKQK